MSAASLYNLNILERHYMQLNPSICNNNFTDQNPFQTHIIKLWLPTEEIVISKNNQLVLYSALWGYGKPCQGKYKDPQRSSSIKKSKLSITNSNYKSIKKADYTYSSHQGHLQVWQAHNASC